ncbi:adenine nucleotide alpha hydrolases-like protein [Aureobasidium sp. EXF-3400]|nr:adenine nucleotide alpha hydrolases-like protein [Aureobasidium sp. EXF-12344]KAI4770315.1 adenine nucleotide alpha hydrolases-like protein [Aureobasidium sp. EXF-3400]
MPGLKVVALISGGKDSFFSILHCHANGHEVVALANLYPAAQDGERSEDIDSYMYQTIGHSVIPLYEEALGLPLYRQEILGGAADRNKSYASPIAAQQNEQDETESLVPLLRKVMAAHPEVNAISTGAILSDYQRTRVESVAIRLGLVPLSYLWQYPFLPPYTETSLLDDMAAAGQDARIIKVASGGLDDGFLWENVANYRTKTRLVRAMERFGIIGDGAALGEGGEFETLAIDGPWPLWKKSIQIEDDDRLVVTGEAGAASLKIKTARLIPKAPSSDFSYEQLRKPTTLDDKFAALELRMNDVDQEIPEVSDESTEKTEALGSNSGWTVQKTDTCTIISNAMAEGASAGEQMTNIISRLTNDHSVNPSSIAFTTILLRDMSEFGAVNLAYGSQFTTPNPPARVTIACGSALPTNKYVSLSAMVLHDSIAAQKQGLHVQSRSYWAPANIGPYSQAIVTPTGAFSPAVPKLIHIAGQIPLYPSAMEFPSQGNLSSEAHFTAQAVLALQHLWRIGQIMRATHFLGAVAFIGSTANTSASTRVETALQSWKLAHQPPTAEHSEDEQDDDFDVWDQRQFGSTGNTTASTQRKDIVNASVPPCFVAEVESLPRDAPIEWASIGVEAFKGSVETQETKKDGCTRHVLTIKSGLEDVVLAGWIAVDDVSDLSKVSLPTSQVCTVYTTQILPESWVKERQPTIIPCYRLWDGQGKRVAAVVAYRQQ